MVELIQEFASRVISEDGRRYVVRVYGAPQPQGPLWDAWLVFFPEAGGEPLVGDQETAQQPSNLRSWALGLEPVYLEGALPRVTWEREQGFLHRHEPWGKRAGDLIEEEEIAYRIAREHLIRMGRAASVQSPDAPPAIDGPPGSRHV
ncbi:MAG TPA: hypothetical protein VIG99_03635 [Myxococcaceae bacterium]|jgi:hypothetical protein